MSTEAEFNARIDRLTERHEALSQSVESLVASFREGRDEMTEIRASIADLTRVAMEHQRRLDNMQGEGV